MVHVVHDEIDGFLSVKFGLISEIFSAVLISC